MILTKKQFKSYNLILSLQSLMGNDILSSSEIAQYEEMILSQKRKLVHELYFENKRRKEFYACKDGRIKSYNPQFIAKNENELIEKLYMHYFDNTLENTYVKWLRNRVDTKIVANKTIEEDMGIWNRFISTSEISKMQISEIKLKHLMRLFQKWTGNGLISRKDFNNRKSVLNGIFHEAVLEEIITHNPIKSISCSSFKYKMPKAKKKAFSIEERQRLLTYLKTLEPDAYILAIMLMFYGIFRIGEIKGLSWEIEDGNTVLIQQQLIKERALQDDMTFSEPHRVLKDPKGNPFYSIRSEVLPPEGVKVLTKMKELNPNGDLLFMYEGRTLTTDTFNRRLMKYCEAIGISYLSSHKIRFTNASMLYDNFFKKCKCSKRPVYKRLEHLPNAANRNRTN